MPTPNRYTSPIKIIILNISVYIASLHKRIYIVYAYYLLVVGL